MRILLAAAMLLAAAPLQGQNVHRVDAGPFSLELPAIIPGVELVYSGETAGTRLDGFAGGHVEDAVVAVFRLRFSLPRDTTQMRIALRRVITDEALITRYVHVLGDTSQAVRDQILHQLSDTTLAARRLFLQQGRTTWTNANPPTWVRFSGEAREIVTADRVTLRSPVTLRIDDLPPLYGIADMSVQRRGEPVVWIVAYASRQRTTAVDEAAARMLASFRTPGDTGAAPR
jgi:hypothetical protein